MTCDDPAARTVSASDPAGTPADDRRVPQLRSLYLYIAGSCNLACRHCWITPAFEARPGSGRYIKIEHVEKAVREAKPLGLRSVKLTGGEPTVHPRFREIVTLLDRERLAMIVETNGTLIDSSMANFLRATPAVSFVSVSLDGSTAEVHEGLRGVPGSFNSAVAGVRALVAAGLRPQLICTLHRGNVAQLEAVAAFAEELGCSSVKFNLLQEVGRGEQLAEAAGLGVQEVLELNRLIEAELVRRHRLKIYLDVPIAFRPIRRLLDDGGACAIRNVLAVLSGGEVSLCGIGTTVPELTLGHVEMDTIGKVWHESPVLARLREQVPFQLEGICGECLHRDSCLGACVADNYHASGRLNAPHGFCREADVLGLFSATRKRSVGKPNGDRHDNA